MLGLGGDEVLAEIKGRMTGRPVPDIIQTRPFQVLINIRNNGLAEIIN
jgi:hypothetical protein